MSELFSNIDWDLLGKWDIIIGITGGIVSVFYGLRWIARRAESRSFIRFISWSVIGDDNEQVLIMTLKGMMKLLGASLVWAIIGALIGLAAVSILYTVSIILGGQISDDSYAAIQYAGLGAFIGALFRGVIWPLCMSMFKVLRAGAEAQIARGKDFDQQKERVAKKINRGRTE